MPWFVYLIVIEFVGSAAYQIYLIDRPRKPKTLAEGMIGAIELAFFTVLIIILGTHYCG